MSLIQDLQSLLLPDNILISPPDAYLTDYSLRKGYADAVVFPQSHNDIMEIVKLCNDYKTPIVPRGLGSGTPGGAVPILGGIVISFEKMDQILEVNPADRYLIAQPGVTNLAVQNAAKKHGFFWAPDPGSADISTIGGNLAYNSAGPRAIKYGTPRENTLGLKAVLGDGTEITTGTKTTKGVVGYDLTRLIIGSEGTLAIITEATLKLLPLPETKATLRACYRSIDAASQAISTIMSQPTTPCTLEFLDSNALTLLRKNTDVAFPENTQALLIIEADGTHQTISEALEALTQAASNHGLIEIIHAKKDAEINELWQARRKLSPELRHVAPKKINEDVCVPVSKIPSLIAGIETLSKKHDILIINFGHAGNGNIHVNLMIDPSIKTQVINAKKCLDELFTLVLTLDGTISGEHGIGIEKREFIEREVGSASLALMKKIKDQFDPMGILNPGKIFTPQS